MDLQLFCNGILRYWTGTPNEHFHTNRLYCRIQIGAAQRELSQSNGERFLAPGYGCVPRAEWRSRYSITMLPNGAHFWSKGDDGLWWLGKISASTTTGGRGIIFSALFRRPGADRKLLLEITPACYTTSTGAVRGSWCLQVHLASALGVVYR